MELKDKKIAFLGDSITAGGAVTSMEHVYWNVVAQCTGARVYGYGIGGTRIARQPSIEDAAQDHYFATRVDQMIPDADVIVIFGGTNDFGHGEAPLGTMADRREDTFYGAYHMLLQKLIVRYPEAQLVVMTPTHRTSEDEVLYNERGVRRQGSLKHYVEAIREVAEFYGVVVVDLFATCPIQPRVPILKEKYMPDGLHPNDAGHKLIAQRLISILNAL